MQPLGHPHLELAAVGLFLRGRRDRYAVDVGGLEPAVDGVLKGSGQLFGGISSRDAFRKVGYAGSEEPVLFVDLGWIAGQFHFDPSSAGGSPHSSIASSAAMT